MLPFNGLWGKLQRFCYFGGRQTLRLFLPPIPPPFEVAFPRLLKGIVVILSEVCAVCSTGRAPTVSRSYTAAPGALSRCAVGLCSPTVHPRNFCCSAFALNAQKFIHIRAARSHPHGARTCYSSMPRMTTSKTPLCPADHGQKAAQNTTTPCKPRVVTGLLSPFLSVIIRTYPF